MDKIKKTIEAMNKDYMDFWLSASSRTRKILDIIEWAIIIGIGFLFPYPKIPFFFISKIIGLFFIITGFYIRRKTSLANKQYRYSKEKIEKIITEGIYSKIRHPCYIGFILYYFGSLFLIGSFSMLIPIFLFSFTFYGSAIKEEKFLKEKFGKEYEEYMKKVPWRFVPYIF